MKNKKRVIFSAIVFLLTIFGAGIAVSQERYVLRELNFHGNEAFSDDALRDLMAVRTGGFLQRSFFDHRVFRDDLENIRQFYIGEGYLESEITSANIDSVNNHLVIDITIFEGPRTYLQEILITGNEEFTEQELLAMIPLSPGDPFRSPGVRQGINNMMNAYGERGRLGASVIPDIMVNPELHRAIIDFQITEGRQYTVEEIRILGLQKTRPFVVLREIPLTEGDIFNYLQILRAERNLYATGLFTSVIAQPMPAAHDTTERVLLVRLRERQSGEFAVGGGYETIEGFRGTFRIQDNNLWGTARQLGFDGQVSQAGYRALIHYMQPWTLGVRLRTDINTVHEYREEPLYNLRRTGVNAIFTRRIFRFTDASILSRIERVELDEIQGALPEDIGTRDLRGLGANVSYDTRDDLFNARRGILAESRNELVGTILRGSDDFATTRWNVRAFRTLRRVTLGSSFNIGWKRPFGDTEIPISELYFAGGPNLMRGFGYQELGAFDDDGETFGGRFMMIGSAELRAPLFSIFGIALFLDAGNVWRSAADFEVDEIRYNAGLGPRITTPFGVIRADFAFKLDRREGETLNEFWFAIGQAF